MKQSFKQLGIYILTGRKVPRADGQDFDLMSLVALHGRSINHEWAIEKSLFYGIRNYLILHRHPIPSGSIPEPTVPFGRHRPEAPKWVETTATLSISTPKKSYSSIDKHRN